MAGVKAMCILIQRFICTPKSLLELMNRYTKNVMGDQTIDERWVSSARMSVVVV